MIIIDTAHQKEPDITLVSYYDCNILHIDVTSFNNGLEGICFGTEDNFLYCAKEKCTSGLYRIDLDDQGKPIEYTENKPFAVENLSGDIASI